MFPTEQLKVEHAGIKLMLDILSKICLAGFNKVEEERVGHGKHEEFHRMMDRLREIYLT